jgi:hypothetical protein
MKLSTSIHTQQEQIPSKTVGKNMTAVRAEKKRVDPNHDWLVQLYDQYNVLKKQQQALHNHWVCEPTVLKQEIDTLRRMAASLHENTRFVVFADVPYDHYHQALSLYIPEWPIKMVGFQGLGLPVMSDLMAKMDFSKLEMIGVQNLDNSSLWFLYMWLRSWFAAGNPKISIVFGSGIAQAWKATFEALAITPDFENIKKHFQDFHEVIQNFATAIALEHRHRMHGNQTTSLLEQLESATRQRLEAEKKFASCNADFVEFQRRSSVIQERMKLELAAIKAETAADITLKDKVKTTEEQLEKATALKLGAEKKLAICSTELQKLQKSFSTSHDRIKGELDALTAAKKSAEDTFIAKLQKAENEIIALGKANKNLKADVESYSLLSPAAYQDIELAVAKATTEYEKQATSLQTLLQQHHKDILAKAKQIVALNQQVSEMCNNLKESQKKIDELSLTNSLLLSKNTGLDKEKSELSLSLESEQKNNVEQKELCKNLSQAVDELAAELDKQQDELDTCRQTSSVAQLTNAMITAENINLRLQISSAHQTAEVEEKHSHKKRKHEPEPAGPKDSLRKKLHEMEARQFSLEAECKLHRERMKTDVSIYNQQKRKIDTLEREVSTKNSALNRARTIRTEKMTTLESQCAQLQKEKEDLQKQLLSTQVKLSEAERIHRESESLNDLLDLSGGLLKRPRTSMHSPTLSPQFGGSPHLLFTPSPMSSPSIDSINSTTFLTLPKLTLGGR